MFTPDERTSELYDCDVGLPVNGGEDDDDV